MDVVVLKLEVNTAELQEVCVYQIEDKEIKTTAVDAINHSTPFGSMMLACRLLMCFLKTFQEEYASKQDLDARNYPPLRTV